MHEGLRVSTVILNRHHRSEDSPTSGLLLGCHRVALLARSFPKITDSQAYDNCVANIGPRARRLTNSALSRFGYELRRRDVSSAETEWGLSDADRMIVRTACRFSMAGHRRMSALVAAVDHCVRENIAGDFVECGVWRGGSALAIALKLEQLGATDRNLWLFDTFAGMTAPGSSDVEASTGRTARELMNVTQVGDGNNVWAYATIDDVRDTMSLANFPDERVRYVVGDVSKTLLANVPEAISLLRLDTDFYASTKIELEVLYPRVADRGLVIVDDYGHWFGARTASDEFFEQLRVRPLMIPLDYSGRMVVKPETATR